MFLRTTFGIFFWILVIIAIIPDATSYSKYGRTCKDIGCRSDETCVMAEDPCYGYSDQCGRYPTCKRISDVSCTSMVCGQNEYCKSENSVPKCVRKSTGSGYESAGISSVNGEQVNGINKNPYANANAPPVPMDPGNNDRHHSSYGSNLGYPPYPSNTGSSASGYPSQSNNQAGRQQDLGYPPYPTQNRMPVPGQPYPGYPGSAYPQRPANYPQQYPGYHNYPNQRGYNQNSIYHKSAASIRTVASEILIGLSGLFLSVMTLWRLN